jgi:hypothetical protein
MRNILIQCAAYLITNDGLVNSSESLEWYVEMVGVLNTADKWNELAKLHEDNTNGADARLRLIQGIYNTSRKDCVSTSSASARRISSSSFKESV